MKKRVIHLITIIGFVFLIPDVYADVEYSNVSLGTVLFDTNNCNLKGEQKTGLKGTING